MTIHYRRLVAIGLALMMLALGGAVLRAQMQPSGRLEIFSWWPAGAGTALDTLVKRLESRYPQVEVVYAAAKDGSEASARAVLKARMQDGEPPDCIQVPAGRELIGPWIAADRLEDLSALYQSEGWSAVFPKDLIRLLQTDGGLWSVPVAIKRSNLMWYVPANLMKWGVTPPETWKAFFQIAPRLRAQGVVPLALASNWSACHLWESVALAVLGPDKWEALWNGNLDWMSEDVILVWQVLSGILEYTRLDVANTWQEAAHSMIQGRFAFLVMGDWAAAYMVATLDLRPGQDFGWSVAPGTNGVFMFLAEAFGLPKGVANRDAALAWLTVVGSREGSDTFNPLKGAISARLDSDLSKYNAYSRIAARDFARDRIVGSLLHGVVASEDFMNRFAHVMENFLERRNPLQAARAMEIIAKENGIAY